MQLLRTWYIAERAIYQCNKWWNDDYRNKKELTTVQKTSEITNEQVLSWAKRIKAQRAQKEILTKIQEDKPLDIIRHTKPLNENMNMGNSWSVTKRRCQYCDIAHKPRRCQAFGSKCIGCRKNTHFQKVCKCYITMIPIVVWLKWIHPSAQECVTIFLGYNVYIVYKFLHV